MIILSRVASSHASPPSSLPFLLANNFIPLASSAGLHSEEIKNGKITSINETLLISTYKVEYLHFLWNHTGYTKNHWTNIRLVCTHLDAFFMFYPNMKITSRFYLNFMSMNLNFALKEPAPTLSNFDPSYYHKNDYIFEIIILKFQVLVLYCFKENVKHWHAHTHQNSSNWLHRSHVTQYHCGYCKL